MSAPRKVRILAAAGARPNFVKIAPLVERLDAQPGAETLLVHTGQHYDFSLSASFFEQLQIRTADIHLETGSGSHGRQTGEILARFEPVARDWKPDVVLVVGDVNSTLACALAAVKLHVPVAHVEAGLRSFDRTMPEEINRVLTDSISAFLFVSEPSGVENLRREGVADERIHLVGNVMIDSLRKFLPVAKKSETVRQLGLSLAAGAAGGSQPFALVTMHRPSNVDEKNDLKRLLGVLAEIGGRVPVIFPAHPRTQERIRSFGLGADAHLCEDMRDVRAAEKGLWLTPPMGYLEFLHLMSEAELVLTDSGGIQEETTALGVPCLTLRDNTERPITVSEGTNQVVGSDPQKILRAAEEILAGGGKKGRVPALWDGKAAGRIVQVLLESGAAR